MTKRWVLKHHPNIVFCVIREENIVTNKELAWQRMLHEKKYLHALDSENIKAKDLTRDRERNIVGLDGTPKKAFISDLDDKIIRTVAETMIDVAYDDVFGNNFKDQHMEGCVKDRVLDYVNFSNAAIGFVIQKVQSPDNAGQKNNIKEMACQSFDRPADIKNMVGSNTRHTKEKAISRMNRIKRL